MNADQLTSQERQIIYRIVCRVVMADNRLDPLEASYLAVLWPQLGITPKEREYVHETLDPNIPMVALVGALSEPARRRLKEEMVNAAYVDGALHVSEARLIADAVSDLLVDESE